MLTVGPPVKVLPVQCTPLLLDLTFRLNKGRLSPRYVLLWHSFNQPHCWVTDLDEDSDNDRDGDQAVNFEQEESDKG